MHTKDPPGLSEWTTPSHRNGPFCQDFTLSHTKMATLPYLLLLHPSKQKTSFQIQKISSGSLLLSRRRKHKESSFAPWVLLTGMFPPYTPVCLRVHESHLSECGGVDLSEGRRGFPFSHYFHLHALSLALGYECYYLSQEKNSTRKSLLRGQFSSAFRRRRTLFPTNSPFTNGKL